MTPRQQTAGLIGGVALLLLGAMLAALWAQADNAPTSPVPVAPPGLRLVHPVAPEDLDR